MIAMTTRSSISVNARRTTSVPPLYPDGNNGGTLSSRPDPRPLFYLERDWRTHSSAVRASCFTRFR